MNAIYVLAAIAITVPVSSLAVIVFGFLFLAPIWCGTHVVRLARLAYAHPRIAGLALLGLLSHAQLLAGIGTIVYLACHMPAVLALAALVWPLAIVAILTRGQWQMSEETQARIVETVGTLVDLAPLAYLAYRAVIDYFHGVRREAGKRCRLCYRYTRYCVWLRRDVFGLLAIGIASHSYVYAGVYLAVTLAPVLSAVALSLAIAVVVCIVVRPVRAYLWSQVERDGILACIAVCAPIAARTIAGVYRDLSRLTRAYWTRDYSAAAVYASTIRHYRPLTYVPCRVGWTIDPAALSSSLIADALEDRSAEYLAVIGLNHSAKRGIVVHSADEMLYLFRLELNYRQAEYSKPELA